MSELNFTWVLGGQCQITKEVQEILIQGEEVAYCCKSIRDVAVFTNKRFIYSDSQGITGKKKEIYSLPYSAINMYSSENAGTLDLSAEIELWTRAGHIKVSLKRDADVRMIDRMIAAHVLR